MLSSRLNAAIASAFTVSTEDNHEHTNESELDILEVLHDPDDGAVVTAHLEALQGHLATLESLDLALGYLDGGMSQERFEAIQRIASDIPSMESYFSKHTASMFTHKPTTVGLNESNEDIIQSIANGVRYVIKSIIEILSWISKHVREYIWSFGMSGSKEAKSIARLLPIVAMQETILSKPNAHDTMAKVKAEEHKSTYSSQVESMWNEMCDVHVSRRNLDMLLHDLYSGINSTLDMYNAALHQLSTRDETKIKTVIEELSNFSVRYEIQDFVKAVSDDTITMPVGISRASAMLRELVDTAIRTPSDFKMELPDYHATLTAHTVNFRPMITNMQRAHRTFESQMKDLVSRDDIGTAAVTLSNMAGSIMTLIEVTRKTRELHSKMVLAANNYLTKYSEIVARAVKAPGTPQEVHDEILATIR